MRKSLKIILIIVLIAVALVGGYFGYLQIIKNKTSKTIETMFTAIKSGDENQIKEYIDIEDAIDDNEEKSEGAEMESIMLKNLNYEIESMDVKFNECTANLKVTNKDLKTVFQNYMTKAISLAFSQAINSTSDEELESELKKYFEEQYDSDSIETIETRIPVTMKRESGKWKISCDENALVDAILPGYREIIDYLNSFNSEE